MINLKLFFINQGRCKSNQFLLAYPQNWVRSQSADGGREVADGGRLMQAVIVHGYRWT